MKCLHTTLVNRMEKEADQVQFFKELRVLNPRRLCDLSHSLADYPSLKLHTILGAQEEWQHFVLQIYRHGPEAFNERQCPSCGFHGPL